MADAPNDNVSSHAPIDPALVLPPAVQAARESDPGRRLQILREAEAALEDGSCDLVAMTRAHIADPELLTKLRRGDTARIRRCVGANQGCLDRAHSGFPLACWLRPGTG